MSSSTWYLWKLEEKEIQKHILFTKCQKLSFFLLIFALFYWGYSWEKVDIYQTLSFYRYLWLYNPALKKAVKAMTALRKVTMIERLCSYHYSRYYTGHYAGFLQCRRHPAFFQSMPSAFGMPSALGYYHKKSTFLG